MIAYRNQPATDKQVRYLQALLRIYNKNGGSMIIRDIEIIRNGKAWASAQIDRVRRCNAIA